MQHTAYIRGLGFFTPERVLTNAELEKMVDTSDEWITSRTGIKERRIADSDQPTSELAYQASLKALAQAGIEPEELTHIILGTFTPDNYIPSSACTLQHKLGNTGAACFDVSAACSGFLYSLETARAYLALHPDAKILVAASEVVSSRTNFNDRNTCVLFGDGAGSAVLTAKPSHGSTLAEVKDVIIRADGSLGDLLTVIGGGSALHPKLGDKITEDYFVQLNGREVFKHAVRSMQSVTKELFAKHGLTMDDIDVFIPHQANMRIIDALANKLHIPEDKIYTNIDRYGNTSAASIPIALSEACENKRITPGSKVALASFGGGFTWAAGLLQF